MRPREAIGVTLALGGATATLWAFLAMPVYGPWLPSASWHLVVGLAGGVLVVVGLLVATHRHPVATKIGDMSPTIRRD